LIAVEAAYAAVLEMSADGQRVTVAAQRESPRELVVEARVRRFDKLYMPVVAPDDSTFDEYSINCSSSTTVSRLK